MASGARNRSRRVTSVPLTSVGSGARILDLIPLPLFLYIPFRIFISLLHHWYIVLSLIALLLLPLYLSILIVLSFPALIFVYLYINNPHHHPSAVALASLQLARTRLSWRRACEAAQLNDGPRRPRLSSIVRPVKIANERGTALRFTLNLARVGLTVDDLENFRNYIAAVLSARRTQVVRQMPGVAHFTIEWERRLPQSALQNPAHQILSTQLPQVELDQDIQIELDTSILVVGKSGAGKSNLTWFILNELNKHGINYRIFVVDPKKVELADLVDSPYCVAYGDSHADSDRVIERFYDDMMETFNRMKKSGTRNIQLDQDNPLNILLIDEILLCRQAREGVDSHFGEILSAGRAAGFICIANSQLGQIDALSRLRDLFPQRVCLAVTSADLTTAVLGPNAEARGARCTEITRKGVGYIFTEFTDAFQRFHLPLIANSRLVAMGEVYEKPKKK